MGLPSLASFRTLRRFFNKIIALPSARCLSFAALLGCACASQPRPSTANEASSVKAGSRSDARSGGHSTVRAETIAPPGSEALSLPRLEVETLGLHIGGGPNDDVARQAFVRAVESQFESFRRCYRLVDAPESGGVFGVDLYIGRDGGHPTVRDLRTGMRPEKFRRCVRDAFERVVFEKPARGPTVISYSLRFLLSGL
jgi:hypothetical protein